MRGQYLKQMKMKLLIMMKIQRTAQTQVKMKKLKRKMKMKNQPNPRKKINKMILIIQIREVLSVISLVDHLQIKVIEVTEDFCKRKSQKMWLKLEKAKKVIRKQKQW